MAFVTVLTNIPEKIMAGESVSWKVSLSDFPASAGWGLIYILVKSDDLISIAASADGDDHLVEIDMATSAKYPAGDYSYQAHITNGMERYQVDSGMIKIVADFATQKDGHDPRSHVKKVLDALEAAIEGRASKTQMFQTVGGVQIQHMPLSDQIRLRNKYAAKYRQEQIAAGNIKSRRIVKSRFSN